MISAPSLLTPSHLVGFLCGAVDRLLRLSKASTSFSAISFSNL